MPRSQHFRGAPVDRSHGRLFHIGTRRRRGHVSRRRPGEKLAGHDHHQREQHAHTDEAAGQTEMHHQILGERRDVNRRSAVTTDHKPHDEAALVRSKPLDRRRGRRRVGQPHADPAQEAEPDDQTGVTFQ